MVFCTDHDLSGWGRVATVTGMVVFFGERVPSAHRVRCGGVQAPQRRPQPDPPRGGAHVHDP